MTSAGVEYTCFECEYAIYKIIEYDYEYLVLESSTRNQEIKARVRVYSSTFFAFFKITNIRLIFYEYLEQFFGCHEFKIDEHFLQAIHHTKQNKKNLLH